VWLVAVACLASRAGATSPPATLEVIDVLVIVIDFADENRATELRYKDGVDVFVPFTVANAQDVFFDGPTSSAARFAEMSHGLLDISGTVIETPLAMNLVDSELSEWQPAADAAAAGQGHPVSNYDRVAYLVPSGFENQIGVGGATATWCWVAGVNAANPYLRESVFSHELGHTLGLEHANTIADTGTIALLSDQADLMGLAEAVHAGGANKWAKGWLDGVRHVLHPADGSAVYDVYPLADTAAQLQAVYIDNHGALPALGEPFETVVTFRKPVGFDSNIALTATDANGQLLRDTVHVHYRRKSGAGDSYLVNALDQGEQYQDCGLTVSVNSIDSTRAQVQVTQTPYGPAAPALQVLPASSTGVYAGTQVFYDLEVTNSDSGTGACAAFYGQQVGLPGPGWSAGWVSAGQEITVGLGQTEIFENFVVQAPIGAAPGLYDVTLELTNDGGSGASVDATASFPYEVVLPPDTEPPTAPGSLVATEFHPDYVVLTWTASTDDVGVQTYRVYHNGVLLPDGGATTAYIDFPPPSGGYTPGATNGYVVQAIDAAGNLSPPSNWAFVGDDLVAPTTPTNLIGFVTYDEVALVWDESTDNVAVTDYEVYRDGMLTGMSSASEWVDTTIASGMTHSYTVVARDGWGNASNASTPFVATVPPPPFAQVPSMSPAGTALLIAVLLGTGGAVRRRGCEFGRFAGSAGTSS